MTQPAPAPTGESLVAKYASEFSEQATATAEPVVADTAEGAGSEGSKVEEDKGAKPATATPPDPNPAPDLSGIPERFHAVAQSMTPEDLAEFRGGWMRRADYTTKTQEAAALKKAADNWERLTKDPEALGAAVSVLEKRRGPASAAPAAEAAGDLESFDHVAATPEEFRAFMRKERASMRAEVRKEFEELYAERAVKPVERRQAIDHSLEAYRLEAGLDEPTMRAAVQRAVQHYEAEGVLSREDWTPEKAVGLVKPFLNGHTSTPPARGTPPPPMPRVAAPGRGSGAIAPLSPPAHMRAGRVPQTPQEMAERTAYILAQQYGTPITANDLETLS